MVVEEVRESLNSPAQVNGIHKQHTFGFDGESIGGPTEFKEPQVVERYTNSNSKSPPEQQVLTQFERQLLKFRQNFSNKKGTLEQLDEIVALYDEFQGHWKKQLE